MNVLTQQKNVPWRWVFLAVAPWFSAMYQEQCAGAVLTLTLKKYMDDPALINSILSLNVLFNILIGAVCLYVSDRIWTPFGRRKPFLIAGWIPMILVFLLVPLVDSLWLLIPLIVIWMAAQDVCSTNEPLQQEVVPPHQRGRAGALFNMMVQLTTIFTFAIVLGRFHEVQYVGRRLLSGEQAAYWLCAAFLIASMLLVGFFFKELPVKGSLAGEKISLPGFFKAVFGKRELWPVYMLVFAQSFMRTQVGAISTLLFVEQWGYSPQEMGTNLFVGALLSIVISLIAGTLADRFNRIKMYIFGISSSLAATLCWYVFVQFMLPDRRPDLWQIIAFGQLQVALGMIAGMVTQPLMYDFIPRNEMGTASAGISYVRNATRWITLLGAGLWVKFYSHVFCEKGTYDYFSVQIYIMILTCVGIVIILDFQRRVRQGKLVAYGRIGVEDNGAAAGTQSRPS